MLRAIDWYQRGAEGKPSPCRFFPSCSEYGREAIEVHGAGRGLWLTTRRLLRCRPFGPSGYDPVPLPDRDQPDHPDRAAAADRSDDPAQSDLSEHSQPAGAMAHAATKEA